MSTQYDEHDKIFRVDGTHYMATEETPVPPNHHWSEDLEGWCPNGYFLDFDDIDENGVISGLTPDEDMYTKIRILELIEDLYTGLEQVRIDISGEKYHDLRWCLKQIKDYVDIQKE